LQQYAPSEWWLSTSDDGAAAAAAAPAVPDVISASTHADLAEQAGNDPAAAGLTTGLTAGLVFAGVFVLIGVVVHTVTALQSRSGEFAVIRAIGLGRRGIAGAATVEQGVLLGFSTLAGLGLGLLVSWLVVPHTVGGLAGLSDVPPLRLQVPWEIITGLGVAIVVLAAILISVQTTLTRHIDVPAVLRAGEDT
ncbi:MAG TPA: FtsX-like permease family protein, partial [Jiangellaceae bacterium]|nr:FtsX-like permease family protein [Jiangellaceae bacterium]